MVIAITQHYRETHGVEDELTVYLDLYHDGIHPTCKCGCEQKIRWYGWTQGFRCQSVSGHDNPWKGKTKETDPRLAVMAEKVSKTRKTLMDSGEITVWSKGKTKETDERLAAVSEKLKEEFASGVRTMWHEGLTKETDERVAVAAKKQSELWKSGKIVPWHKGKTKKECPSLAWSEEEKLAQRNKILMTWDEVLIRLSTLRYTKIISSSNEYTRCDRRCIRIQCLECGHIEVKTLGAAQTDRCNVCNPPSVVEREWLNSLNIPQDCRNRWIFIGNKRYNVDGLINGTIYEFYGDYWHGHPRYARDRINHLNKKTMSELYEHTMTREAELRAAGYVVITMWESDWMKLRKTRPTVSAS